MRLFLGFILFDMVYHSLAVLSPYPAWCAELGVARFPRRLPTAAEMDESAGRARPGKTEPVADRVFASLDSVWDFFRPWPGRATRRKLRDWPSRGEYLVCWLTSRLDFCEHLAGISQEWVMFSPSVVTEKTRARARLVFADGSTREVRLPTSDPEDPSDYSRWFVDRVNNAEVDVSSDDPEMCLGYCNYVAHRHPVNERGKRLVRIYLFPVTYELPGPDVEDPRAFLHRQKGPPAGQRGKDYFAADVRTRPDGSVAVRRGKL
jgi:hypothetical protein